MTCTAHHAGGRKRPTCLLTGHRMALLAAAFGVMWAAASSAAAAPTLRIADLVELQKRGEISERLKGYAVLAQEEALSLISALGGLESISEQRLVLIQDAARLGLVLRAVLARFLQGDGEPELASRVATITSARPPGTI